MLRKSILGVVVLGLLAGPAAWGGHHEVMNYEDLPKAWETAYNTAGAEAVAALYLEDGMRMPPDMPTVKGREAIQAQVQGGMDQGLAKVEITTGKVMEMGDMGFAFGSFKGMDADGNVISVGKWVNSSKKVDGKWYVYFDIWNMDAPAPAPPAE